MPLFTIKKPLAGDPIRARDQRRLLAEVENNSLALRDAGLLSQSRRLLVVVFQVKFLLNPGEITAQINGDPAPIPVNYIVHCDETFSELSRDGVTYVYTDFNTRVADGTENQVLVPSLNVDDTFIGMRVQDQWRVIDLGGRQWAAVP